MQFYKVKIKYVFPVPKTKTIGDIAEILVRDGKYTGT